MRHSKRVSGITNLSLNSIDVLSGLENGENLYSL
ncbi:hypothetical protein [Enterococcus faecalis]